jgi:flagellar protein FliS
VNNPYQKASKAYQSHGDGNMSQLQIVVELYRGILKNIKIARDSWNDRHLDVMSNHIIKTFDIIEALQSSLDLEKGGEDAKFLNHFYSVVFSALSHATAKPDPAAEFDAIIAYVQTVYDRWYALAYPNRPVETSADAEPQAAH